MPMIIYSTLFILKGEGVSLKMVLHSADHVRYSKYLRSICKKITPIANRYRIGTKIRSSLIQSNFQIKPVDL